MDNIDLLSMVFEYLQENGYPCDIAINRNHRAYRGIRTTNNIFRIVRKGDTIIRLFSDAMTCAHEVDVHNPDSLKQILSIIQSCTNQCAACAYFNIENMINCHVAEQCYLSHAGRISVGRLAVLFGAPDEKV